ncbi:FAD binding domain-containing protein [Histoplasma capsulatum var. duboisii H88]|uniref:FAD binding domain-containing protein n=1 Tax=Ajellomyces capsulatus (strain H88) TaxID=544711 RepID=F0UQZ3_AJEC8|nr:FAD binding domain-containing protein [Histoplasma capsulatum var. duboisii H88]
MKRAHSVTPPRKLKMGPSADGEGFMDGHGGLHTPPPTTTVAVVGAGPSGLMLASNLVRYGIKTTILDDRPDKTSTGKADGMQPKTIETFKQLRLADDLLRKGVKVYDISFWESTVDKPLHRTSRQSHYPDHVGASNPFVLLAHQGMIEDVLIQDMEQRGVFVSRSSPFIECSRSAADGKMHVIYEDATTKAPRTMEADYLIGCDGAHSKVRPFIPEAKLIGEMTNASWGVLDEWFGNYVVSQRVANHFADAELQIFIAGDVNSSVPDTSLPSTAGHCHSALAAQGANTSMHDSFNLAWKLNLVARDLAPRSLLATYEAERKKIAQDLIDFDAGHVKAFSEGDEALTRNFDENIRFISGVGAEYAPNILNQVSSAPQLPGSSINILKPGALLTPARVTRFIDANPVDIELDIPLLSQFRIYMFTPSLQAGTAFLESLCNYIQSPTSFLSRASMRANKSYAANPPPAGPLDEFAQPDRYTPVSKLFTYALVTRTAKCDAEITSLPALLQASRWTFYLDDVIPGGGCTEKWLGNVPGDEVAIVNVRPDGYVGSIWRCGGVGQKGEAGSDLGRKAAVDNSLVSGVGEDRGAAAQKFWWQTEEEGGMLVNTISEGRLFFNLI